MTAIAMILAQLAVMPGMAAPNSPPPVKIRVEREGRFPLVWGSLPILVSLENVSSSQISVRSPAFAIGPGDHWTTIDFLVERDGQQLRLRYNGMYESLFGFPTITLKPGERSAPFRFDVLENKGHLHWMAVDSSERPQQQVSDRLGWGRARLRIKYFNGVPPMRAQDKRDDSWIGEVVSEPFDVFIL